MAKFKRVIISVLTLACCALFAAGCGGTFNVPPQYSVEVTYYFSGGRIDDYKDKESIMIAYKPDSKIVEPGKSSTGLKEVVKKGYSLSGWYVAQTDSEGKVVVDENKAPVASSQKFDFSTRVNKSMTLVAVWGRAVKVTFVGLHYSESAPDRDYVKYLDGAQSLTRPAYSTSYDADGKGYAVEGYYWSYNEATKTYSDEVTFPVSTEVINEKLGDSQQGSDGYLTLNVYTKLSSSANS